MKKVIIKTLPFALKVAPLSNLKGNFLMIDASSTFSAMLELPSHERLPLMTLLIKLGQNLFH